jgi:hypothetical protein
MATARRRYRRPTTAVACRRHSSGGATRVAQCGREAEQQRRDADDAQRECEDVHQVDVDRDRR